ncbi:MAG TPA: hypothetical protein VI387_00380 [Candidatus Brocadiales bacterium]|nr:hypothetical protein [Candidatus Brocadiales bacterium]
MAKKKRRGKWLKEGEVPFPQDVTPKTMAELTKDHDLPPEDQKEDGKEAFDDLLGKVVPKTTPKKK